MSKTLGTFDVSALYAAMDQARQERGLSWRKMADEMNTRANWPAHPLSPSTIVNMGRTGVTSCQHALGYLHWLGRSPESFVSGFHGDPRLPELPSGRWDIPLLAQALDTRRREKGMTWGEVAREIGCSAGQLSGLKRIRYGISIVLAMRIVAWLDRPSVDFIHPATRSPRAGPRVAGSE